MATLIGQQNDKENISNNSIIFKFNSNIQRTI